MAVSSLAIEYDANNYMERAMAPAEARYKAQVMADTWGHLEPKPNAYPGWLIFINGTHDDRAIVDWWFRGVNACPLLYDHMNEYIEWATDGKRWMGDKRRRPAMRIGVYRFVGNYVRLKNYSGRFRGKLEQVHIPINVR